MDSWTAPDFIDLLESAINADSTITALSPKVTVYSYWPSPNEPMSDTVIIGDNVTDSQEPAAVGQLSHDDEVFVRCYITIARAGAGAKVNKAARDRAKEILDAIDTILRTSPPQVGKQTLWARTTDREMDQFPGHLGSGNAAVRVCTIDFKARYKART